MNGDHFDISAICVENRTKTQNVLFNYYVNVPKFKPPGIYQILHIDLLYTYIFVVFFYFILIVVPFFIYCVNFGIKLLTQILKMKDGNATLINTAG